MARTSSVFPNRPRPVGSKRRVWDVNGGDAEGRPHVEHKARESREELLKRRRAESGKVFTAGTHGHCDSPRRLTPTTTAFTAAARKAISEQPTHEPFVQPTRVPHLSFSNEVIRTRRIHVAAKERLREAVERTASLVNKAAEAARYASSTRKVALDLKVSAGEHSRRARELADTVAALERALLQLRERAVAAYAHMESFIAPVATRADLLRTKYRLIAGLGEEHHALMKTVEERRAVASQYLDKLVRQNLSYSTEGLDEKMDLLAVAVRVEKGAKKKLKDLRHSYGVDERHLLAHLREQKWAADKHMEALAGVAECEALLASAVDRMKEARARKAEVEQDVAKAQEKMEEAMTEMAKIKGQETETVVKEKAWLATAHETRGAWYHARSALELARKAFFSQISIEL